MEQKQKWALLSVFNKDGIVDFAKRLKALGWNIISSGGTAHVLKTSSIDVMDTAELVGGGAILGHNEQKTSIAYSSGESFEVDTSKEACNRFGFDHNDRVKSQFAGEATVIGVAYDRDSRSDVLWVCFDKDNGKVSIPCQHDTLTKI